MLVDTLDVTINGEPVELLMSWGLLNELVPLVRDLVNVGLIAIDTELRYGVMNCVLAKRDEKGKILEALDMYNLNIKVKDVQAIVMWVQEHLLDFFLGAIESATKAHLPHLDRISMRSGAGSPN